ncbi:ESX-1 secretion-associated protein EspI isoform X2 [Oryctolagus cuniculus]|uniref:ESX-1 secretion-associated protein EspI isoform X2 n=1 Tax=Oryctolagus cuniculus TaxID=9986 RepID=UPI0038793D78
MARKGGVGSPPHGPPSLLLLRGLASSSGRSTRALRSPSPQRQGRAKYSRRRGEGMEKQRSTGREASSCETIRTGGRSCRGGGEGVRGGGVRRGRGRRALEPSCSCQQARRGSAERARPGPASLRRRRGRAPRRPRSADEPARLGDGETREGAPGLERSLSAVPRPPPPAPAPPPAAPSACPTPPSRSPLLAGPTPPSSDSKPRPFAALPPSPGSTDGETRWVEDVQAEGLWKGLGDRGEKSRSPISTLRQAPAQSGGVGAQGEGRCGATRGLCQAAAGARKNYPLSRLGRGTLGTSRPAPGHSAPGVARPGALPLGLGAARRRHGRRRMWATEEGSRLPTTSQRLSGPHPAEATYAAARGRPGRVFSLPRSPFSQGRGRPVRHVSLQLSLAPPWPSPLLFSQWAAQTRAIREGLCPSHGREQKESKKLRDSATPSLLLRETPRQSYRLRRTDGRREREKDLLSCSSLPKWLQRLVLHQAEARSWEPLSSLPRGSRAPSTWAIFCLLS